MRSAASLSRRVLHRPRQETVSMRASTPKKTHWCSATAAHGIGLPSSRLVRSVQTPYRGVAALWRSDRSAAQADRRYRATHEDFRRTGRMRKTDGIIVVHVFRNQSSDLRLWKRAVRTAACRRRRGNGARTRLDNRPILADLLARPWTI